MSPTKPLVRTDSAFYGSVPVGAAIRGCRCFGQRPVDSKAKAAIAIIVDHA
jgi:hypothetical protein